MHARTRPPRSPSPSYRWAPQRARGGSGDGTRLLDTQDVVDDLARILAGRGREELLVDPLGCLAERRRVGLGDGDPLGLHLRLDVAILVEDELAVPLLGVVRGLADRLLRGRVLLG